MEKMVADIRGPICPRRVLVRQKKFMIDMGSEGTLKA
jgi:hypothetical protein